MSDCVVQHILSSAQVRFLTHQVVFKFSRTTAEENIHVQVNKHEKGSSLAK